MRAIVLHQYGPAENLRFEEFPAPELRPGMVLVEIHAAGVNFTDVLSTSGRSQFLRSLPTVPGVEGAGVVLAVGEGVTRVRPGDRVLGGTSIGLFAEQALFREEELAVIPDHMDMTEAATFYTVNMTAYQGLVMRVNLQPGENLLVLAAGGGLGLVTVEMGKALGARVVAAASSQAKLDVALRHGADAGVLYSSEPLDLEAQKAFTKALLAQAPRIAGDAGTIVPTAGVRAEAGYHVVMDGVGGTYMEPAMRALGWEGRYISVGFAAGVPQVSPAPLLFKNADLYGLQGSSDKLRLPSLNTEAMTRLFAWHAEGKISAHISEVLPMAEASKALAMLRDRKVVGRVVLVTDHYRPAA